MVEPEVIHPSEKSPNHRMTPEQSVFTPAMRGTLSPNIGSSPSAKPLEVPKAPERARRGYSFSTAPSIHRRRVVHLPHLAWIDRRTPADFTSLFAGEWAFQIRDANQSEPRG